LLAKKTFQGFLNWVLLLYRLPWDST
jgi:hypothetical protein